jgi:transposase-like protein
MVEQDHRRVKNRIGPDGFKRFFNARRVLADAELCQKIVQRLKGQFQVPEEVRHRSGRDVA